MGTLGKQRKEFCINYIKHKQASLSRIQREITKQIERDGKEVTCQKGCSYCCVLYIEANIQECEAIVYHLYQNDEILSLFLQQYPEWRGKMRQSGDIFNKCEQILKNRRNTVYNSSSQQELADALLFLKLQNIPCPFLYNGICTIYDVRPYTCLNHLVTTPAEWCSPLNPHEPTVYQTTIEDELLDLAFYPKSLDKPLITYMPLVVYQILSSGFNFLSNITGFTELVHNE
ncbi:hypothetical protein ACFLYF_06215 [Chloroflexota bacterium]